MSATHKVVNGVEVPLSPEEAAAIEAEWAANPPPTAQRVLEALRQRAVDYLAAQQQHDALLLRALVLMLLDDRNMLAGKINAILDAVDGAANLAGLKTAVAAITDAPTYTAAQVRTAINNKATAGDADE